MSGVAADAVTVGAVLRRQRRDIVTGALLGSVHQGCEALVAVIIGIVVDRAIAPSDASALLRWLAVLGLVFVALALSAAVGYYRLDRAAQAIAHDLRLAVVRRAVADDAPADAGARTGEVLSIATSDAARVGNWAPLAGGLASAVAALVVGVAVLFAGAWQLAVVVLVAVPAAVVIGRRVADPLAERSAREQEAVADSTAVAVDLVRGLRVVQGIGGEEASSSRYEALSRSVLAARVHALRWAGVHDGVSSAVSAGLVVVVAWWGGRLALDGAMTIGQLVAAVGLAQFLVGPVSRTMRFSADAAVVRASRGRVAELLRPAVGGAGDRRPVPADTSVELHDVRAGSLAGITMSIAGGEWVGIVAPDAGDAATLLDVLALRRPQAPGTVVLGGEDVRDLDAPAVRRALVVSDHDSVLFDGTVDDNVRAAAAAHADVAAVEAATTTDEVISAVGAGHSVGDLGRFLSGGQRQRVALARALATDAPILVLHDPTTAVDSVTEAAIADGLVRIRAGRSTVIVTSSPSLLAVCNRVVVIRDGQIAAEGTHTELSASDAYRRLVLM